MLVWGTRLSLDAMLGIVVVYLPGPEVREEVVRPNDLDSNSVLLVVLVYLLESLQVDILGCSAIGVGEHAFIWCMYLSI